MPVKLALATDAAKAGVPDRTRLTMGKRSEGFTVDGVYLTGMILGLMSP
jgi:hypothetical protein